MSQKTPDSTTGLGVLIPSELLGGEDRIEVPSLLPADEVRQNFEKEFEILCELEGADPHALVDSNKVLVNEFGYIDVLDLSNTSVTNLRPLLKLSSLRILLVRNTLINPAELLPVLKELAPRLEVYVSPSEEIVLRLKEWIEKQEEACLRGPVILLTRRKTPDRQVAPSPIASRDTVKLEQRVWFLRRETWFLVLLAVANMSNLDFSRFLKNVRGKLEGFMNETSVTAEEPKPSRFEVESSSQTASREAPLLEPPEGLSPQTESPELALPLEQSVEQPASSSPPSPRAAPASDHPQPTPDALPESTQSLFSRKVSEVPKTIGGNVTLHWFGEGGVRIACDACGTKNMWLIRREALGDDMWNCDLFAKTSWGRYRTTVTLIWRDSGEEDLGFLNMELEEISP